MGHKVKDFPWSKTTLQYYLANYHVHVCERRTRSLAKRLAHTPDILQKYMVTTFQNKIWEVSLNKWRRLLHQQMYTTFHIIQWSKESSITPNRIVYDCSCRQSVNQPRLTDYLMVGPTFLNDMCSILLQFRSHQHGLSTDIKKAFLHVTYVPYMELIEIFHVSCGCLIPLIPESNLIVYHFRVVLFGSVSSPFMLNVALATLPLTDISIVSSNRHWTPTFSYVRTVCWAYNLKV